VRGLGEKAGFEAEEPGPQSRLDPERLWPRRRS
jgi:hypothetical protein